MTLGVCRLNGSATPSSNVSLTLSEVPHTPLKCYGVVDMGLMPQ